MGDLSRTAVLQPLLFKSFYEDMTRQEKLVRACDRDWMLIRPAQMTDGQARARFGVVQNIRGFRAGTISRADVAVWTIAQLKINKFLYRAVMLTE